MEIKGLGYQLPLYEWEKKANKRFLFYSFIKHNNKSDTDIMNNFVFLPR